MTVEEVHNRINELAEEKGMSIYELAQRSGIAESTLYNLFERGTMPKLDTLDRICEGLEIAVSDFFIFTAKPGERYHMTDEEIELLEVTRELTKRNREHLMIYAQGMWDSQQPVKDDKKRVPKRDK